MLYNILYGLHNGIVLYSMYDIIIMMYDIYVIFYMLYNNNKVNEITLFLSNSERIYYIKYEQKRANIMS